MNLFPEQISAAGSRQLEAQLQMLTKRHRHARFDSAEKLMALHFEATRGTLEQSTALLRQVAAAKDPRDLFALGQATPRPSSTACWPTAQAVRHRQLP